MLKHVFHLTFRNFKKFKNTFLINLIGLSSGIACAVLIFLWVDDERNMDKFHAKNDQLFQVMEHQKYSGNIMTTWSTPGILSESMKADFPEVEYAATTTWISDYILTYEDKDVSKEGFHVGQDYFNIFSYKLLAGNENQVLADKSSIVISEQVAKELFGGVEAALGKTIELQHRDQFKVTGVFENISRHSSYQFDFVLSFEVYKDDNDWVLEWGNNGPRSYLLLAKGTNVLEFNEKIKDYIKEKEEDSHVTLFLKAYAEQYLYGKYEDGKNVGGRIEYVRLFSMIAFFILVIACINFMNLSTARASRRMKEIGVKKAIGARKEGLVLQFLTESMVMSFLSMFVALALVWFAMPVFNEITSKEMFLQFNLPFTLMLFGVCLITGLLAGSYPALYLSGFGIIAVLKGNVKGAPGEVWIRKGLVVFQFWLSVILIVTVVVIYNQIDYVQSKNLGYDKENILVVPQEGRVADNLPTFLNELNKVPGVKMASSIGHTMVGQQNNTYSVDWDGKDPEFRVLFENMQVNYNCMETLGMQLVDGRTFSKDYGADSSSVILNEAGLKVMGLEDPVGQQITLFGETKYTIIGIVKDFNFQSLHRDVKPVFMRVTEDNTWNVLARLEAGNIKETVARIETLHKEFNPGFPLDYNFLDESYQQQYAAEQRVSVLSRYFAAFAILISCLGLFGLAAFTAERRMKEIGVRKVLGASEWKIVTLLTADFTKMVVVSIVLALPVSYWFLGDWLTRFAYRIDLEIWFFAGAGLMALLVAWLTVGVQSIRAAHANPVDCLRDE